MTTAKRSSPRRKSVNYKTFKVSKDVKPFIQFNATYQTLYWTVLSVIILALGIWIVNTQIQIIDYIEHIT